MRAAGGHPAVDPSPVRELCVLGPTMVREYGESVALRPRELDVLAALAVHHPLPAGWGAIAETIWPDAHPKSARETIQNHVARVRRRMGAEAILTDGTAYRLCPEWTIDVATFEAELGRAQRAVLQGDDVLTRMHLGRALTLVRGEAFADLPDGTAVNAARARRTQQRLAAEERYVLALLAGREYALAVAEAAGLVSDEPFRETRWMLHALALYRDGQRRESLVTLQRGREHLRGVGLDSGPAVHRLESLILTDDQALHDVAAPTLVGHDAVGPTDLLQPAEVFVGRTHVLDLVRRELAGRFDHATALTIDVTGASGTGKSSLARRVAAQAAIDGWHVAVVTGTGHPGRVLEPLGEVVRQLIDMEPSPADAFDRHLLDDVRALWDPAAPGHGRGDPGEAIVQVIEQHASRFPTLLVIDDAHRVPVTAGSLLTRLRATASTLALVTLTVPDVDADAPAMAADLEIVLDGLDIDDARRLFELVSTRTTTTEDFAVLHTATGGVPALIRQFAIEARDGDDAGPPAEAAWGSGIFDIALARLGPNLTSLVALLAVAGGPLPPGVIATVAELDGSAFDRRVGEGTFAGILAVDANGLVHLASEALGTAALAHLDEREVAALHGRLGSAFLDNGHGPLAAVAHVVAGSELGPARKIDVAATAAAIARDATMFEEAAQILAGAAAIASTAFGANHPRTLRLMIDRAENMRLAGDQGNVPVLWDVLDRARLTDDGDTMAMAVAGLCKLGPLTESGRQHARLAAEIERALEMVCDPRVRAECAGQATLFYSLSGGVDRCRQLFDESLHAARASGDPATLLHSLGNVYASLVHPDDWELRAALAAEMLTLAERVDDDAEIFEALHVYFSTQVIWSDPLLRTTFERQARLATSLRTPGRRWMAGYQEACLAYLDGRLDDSMAISEEIFERSAISRSRALGTYFMNLCVVRLAQGRGDELAADVDRIIDEQGAVPGWHCVGAWLAALRGDDDRVRDVSDAWNGGAELPRDMSWSGATMLLGRAVARSGDACRAKVVTDVLAPYSGMMTWIGSTTVGPFDLALAELAIVIGDRAAAGRYAVGAQRSIDRIGAVVFQPDIDAVTAALAPT